MKIKNHLHKVHAAIAKSETLSQMAVKLRNQCNAVIQNHFRPSHWSSVNGEDAFIKLVAPHCRSFFDIGANKGQWAEVFVAHCPGLERAVMFEPSRNAQKKIAERGLDKKIQLVKAAVADRIQDMDFFEEENAGETSSLVPGFSNPSAVKTTVPCVTVDTEMQRLGWNEVDFMKIDVEGYDLFVIKGAKQALTSNAITFIQFEYNTPWSRTGSTLREAMDILEAADYSIYLISPFGLHPFIYQNNGDFFGYSNFVGVNNKKDTSYLKDSIRYSL